MQVLTISLLIVCEFSTAFTKNVVDFNFYSGNSRSLLIDHFKRESFREGITTRQRNYMINLSIGTPAQDASLVIDTGSSDLWLMEPGNPYCATRNETFGCSDGSFFNRVDSSTWTSNSTDFDLDTRSGNPQQIKMTARGQYGQDSISVNGKQISLANFAIANETDTTHGRFGIGPRYGEASVTDYDANGRAVGVYENLPLQMKNQGLISKAAYSLFLAEGRENGTLLFGGVDHSKYTGNLGVVPILKLQYGGVELQEPSSFSVMLNGAGIKDPAGNTQWLTECAIPVTLDTGSTFSYLPGAIAGPVRSAMGATFGLSTLSNNLYCDTVGSLLLDFSGVQVEVPFQNMMIPFIRSNGSAVNTSTGRPVCHTGIFYEGTSVDLNEQYFLGDSILRSLYVVYDLENWEIGIASTKFASDDDDDDDDENIEEITDTIPLGYSAPSYSSTIPRTSYSTASEATVTGVRAGGSAGYIIRSGSSAMSATDEPTPSDTTTGSNVTPGVRTFNGDSSAGQYTTGGEGSGNNASPGESNRGEQQTNGGGSTLDANFWLLSFLLFFL